VFHGDGRPVALDLFCGAGGAGMGLYQAGFDVVGVDHADQAGYPFRFIRGDAMCPPVELAGFAFVWASPPCQAYSITANMHRRLHPRLLERVRSMLVAGGVPWCIENVPGAPMPDAFFLEGVQFGLNVLRRRYFEASFFVMTPPVVRGVRVGFSARGGVSVFGGKSGGRGGREKWSAAMGIDWMTNPELAQAVPPAYSRFIADAGFAQGVFGDRVLRPACFGVAA
jgi:DNA (cytosine-5)-methyltransferase 1